MPNLPTPLKAALGLAATALDEARRLPETLPQASVVAVTTAMQVSLRVQQRIAALATRGDEVLSQLRGTPAEPPEWATFDESPAPALAEQLASRPQPMAAFDRVPEGSAGDPGPEGDDFDDLPPARPTQRAKKAAPASKAARASKPAPAKQAPPASKPAPAKQAPPATKAAPVKKAARASMAPAKAAPAKISTTKAAPAKTTKQAAKRAVTRSEPLAAAAKRAKPSAAPNPATMAAEIVHAHEAADHGTGPARRAEAGSGSE